MAEEIDFTVWNEVVYPSFMYTAFFKAQNDLATNTLTSTTTTKPFFVVSHYKRPLPPTTNSYKNTLVQSERLTRSYLPSPAPVPHVRLSPPVSAASAPSAPCVWTAAAPVCLFWSGTRWGRGKHLGVCSHHSLRTHGAIKRAVQSWDCVKTGGGPFLVLCTIDSVQVFGKVHREKCVVVFTSF